MVGCAALMVEGAEVHLEFDHIPEYLSLFEHNF